MSTETSSASASATTTGVSSTLSMPSQFKVVGIILAVVSGLLIGSSFVLKKKGLIQSQAGGPAGEGVAYLKSAMWWTGMIIMILGEICNFAAYAFVEAIVVTPLGALSVVVCAIMSSFFLNEKLTFFGWVGCFLCIVGSVIIALNGPAEQSVGSIREFQSYFVSIGFLVYGGLAIATAIVIVFFVAPKYGKKSMIWYILVCSLIGGLSVSCTQALGAAIVTSIRGQNQFTYWFTYFVLIFVVVTLLIEVYYLNVALALFNTAMVTPTYYVLFTFFTLVTSVILYRGFNATVTSIITVVMGFLVICSGITILQMSKVDPTTLSKLDRKSTILLAANRPTEDAEKGESTAIEEPGVDAIRGSFGALGSIVRARSLASSRGTVRSRHAVHGHSRDDSTGSTVGRLPSLSGMKRHQLFDNPVPPLPEDAAERISMYSSIPNPYRPESVRTGEETLGAIHHSPKKSATIQFRQSDLPGHDHLSVDREGHAAELALDDFIQRATSPLSTTPTGGTATTSGSTARPLYDDPYAFSPRTAAARFNPHPLRHDSLASLPEHTGSSTPEGVESPPRSGGGRFQRSYPQDREMDREESMSLVGAREMGFDNDRDEQRARDSGEEGHPGVTNGGIRLLPSLPRR